MLIRAVIVLGLTLIPCSLAGATSVDLPAASFKSGMPSRSDAFAESVPSIKELDAFVSLHFDPVVDRLVAAKVKFRVIGTTDGVECSEMACDELALRRARLYQNYLISHGTPESSFCALGVRRTYFGSIYVPAQNELEIARRAEIEPVFNGCT